MRVGTIGISETRQQRLEATCKHSDSGMKLKVPVSNRCNNNPLVQCGLKEPQT